MNSYPSRLKLARLPTPLQRLNRVSDELGANIWIKRDDLTGSGLSGNKVRKLEFSLAEAIEQGCNTVITCGGVQSNHCRATAIACAQLGLKAHLVLRGEENAPVDGNFLLDCLCGAEVEIHPPRGFSKMLSSRLLEAQALYADRGHKAFIIPTGASDGIGIWGYICAAQELAEDFNHHQLSPSHVVCATGSGGTHAGLLVGGEIQQWQTQILGFAVCDDEEYFTNKIGADISHWAQRYNRPNYNVNVQVNDQYIGPGYAKADPEVFEAIAWLARCEGIVLDPVYTGKAFYGLTQELKAGNLNSANDIVFLHTGGIYGLFPYRDQALPSINALTGQVP